MRMHATQAGDGQYYIVASCPDRQDHIGAASAAYAQIADVLRETGTEIVHERLFGSLGVHPAVMAARREALSAKDVPATGPVTYIQGRPPWGEGLSGIIIHAVGPVEAGDRVWTVTEGDVPRGRAWRRRGAAFLVLQNIQGLSGDPASGSDRPSQVRRMIERAEQLLQQQGATFRDVLRTWFYLSDILSWYDRFNQARSAKYAEFGLLPASGAAGPLLPASTGIQGDAPGEAAGTLDLLAMAAPASARPAVQVLRNPAQQDASCYGSAFSRGVLVREPDVTLIQVSGTAAVDEKGISLHPGDVRAQIGSCLDKIEALLTPVGAGLADICAAAVFVKRPEDATVFWQMAADRGLGDFPGVCVVADICRDELLFEIDAEAAIGGRRVSPSPSAR